MIGTILDEKYRIEAMLGEGGMGAVYAAEDVRSGERVAVKVIHTRLAGRAADTTARFEREARAASGIDTEHIVRCLDAGTDPATEQPYMVLEYLTGEDFQRVLRRTGPVDPDLALRVVAQAAIGLARAHEAKIVHRDIKPANLFLAERAGGGDELVVKILDFGVAKIRKDPNEEGADNDGLTRTGSMLGSPLYMSPEQARSVKTVDQRADIWSLGVVLYKAVAGRTPFDHISSLGDLVLALWNEPPPNVQQFAPWVSPEVAALLDRMLRIEASERFQSMTELLDALSPLLPDGNTIRGSMLVPLPEQARQRTAATYFRRFDTRPRADRPSTDPAPQRARTSSPDGQRPGSSSDLSVQATTGGSGERGPLTENGLSSTDHGSVVAPPPARVGRGTAVFLALVALAAGIGAALFLLPGLRAAPTGEPAATTGAAPTAPQPTVTPAPEPTASAASPVTASTTAASTTAASTAASATTASPIASTPPVVSASAPSAAPPTARPRATAVPTATAAPRPTGFTDFGDRK